MRLTALPLCGLLIVYALTTSGCGGGSTPVPATNAQKADDIMGIPAGWTDANNKSAEYYQAGKYAEAIAVLESFANAHPKFADAELMLGDNLLTMPALPDLPDAERLKRAATHMRRGLELATDDYGRNWGTKGLERVAEEQKQLGLAPNGPKAPK